MKPDKNILDSVDRIDGMRVPEGYFADFAAKMEAMLPVTEFENSQSYSSEEQNKQPLTRWQRVRPYVYMAAMFAGAWCMLKMFSLMSPSSGNGISFDNDPVIAKAIGNEQFIDEYFLDSYSQYDLYQDIMDDPESFYMENSYDRTDGSDVTLP